MDSEPGNAQRRSHPFATLRKESSADEDFDLYKERTSSLVPLTRSPFKPIPGSEESDVKYHPDELVVSVSKLPWSDLLLEIAMTTAFASLTDGTPILEASSVASYLSFFALVWWVWASQVAYNVRFRQSDWLHRLFAFLQLVVFCALAAFTNNFDVTNGIANKVQEETQITKYQMADFANVQDIAVANFRNNRLPTLNARGVSLTMAFSRLVLLMQYLLAYFHASRTEVILGETRCLRRTSFYVHIGTLLASSLCYFVAYGVIGKSPDKDDQIAKLFLWYMPILAEVASHFIAASLPGRVRYPAKEIYKRSASVFVIILGGGLDKITNGFQYIVGNISLGFERFGLILCGVVIFALLFTLYFGTSEGDSLGSRRALALFFFQFFFLSAIIVTLQGIAARLEVGNIGIALETPFKFVMDTKALMESKGFGVGLNESDYDYELTLALNNTGIALSSLLEIINYGVDDAVNITDYNLTYNYLLHADIYIVATVLRNFNAIPEDGSLLWAKLNAFYDSSPRNYSMVNNVTFNELAEMVIITNATPALWFYAAGGSVLVTLALMCLINRWPRDKYEWGQTISRLIVGSLIIVFTAVDVNANNDILDENLQYQGSRIWFLATHSGVLPPYASAMLVEQLIELALLYMAGRSYGNFSFSVVWRKVPRVFPYKKTECAPLPEPGRTTTMIPPAEAPSFDLQSTIPQGHTRASGRPRLMWRQMSS